MNQNKGTWIGVVSLIVIAALGLWWLSATLPLDTLMNIVGKGETATSTEKAGKTPVSVSNVSMKSQDVATIVRGLKNASTFNTYFRSTGVAATVNPKSVSKYTIFVPTNGAFAQLAAGTVANMSAAEKKRLIQYHVVSGRAIDTDAQLAGEIQALSGDMLNFSYGASKIPMVNSAIVITQYEGKNGVVIVIDNVLLPPKKTN